MALLHTTKSDAPFLESVKPRAAIPGGVLEVHGVHLMRSLAVGDELRMPHATLGETEATLDLARATRALVRVPVGAIASDLVLVRDGIASNVVHANVGVPMVEELHLISNPAVDRDGNVYAMVSGPRGEQVPVSIFRVERDLQVRPFVRDLLNVSALACGVDGYLYASSRQEGVVWRISNEGEVTTFAEGMGLATGLAFDGAGNLFVGDRSGTIFKISPEREILVFATLEPSVAAYHLAFRDDGVLLVTAPTTSSNQSIFAIDPDGSSSVYFNGLGRPQGMALDVDGNVYVAASWRGQRGIVRISGESAETRRAEVVVSGTDLVGLCFLEDGCAALATNSTLFHIDLGIQGRMLV
ncbi:MAG: gluconolaconase [Bryocella sp.]